MTFLSRARWGPAAVLSALLLSHCSSSPPAQPPSPTASFKTFDSSKYPGLNITSGPLPESELALVDVLARHDLLLKTMAEQEPASYAPLYEVMTKTEADKLAATIKKNHDFGYKSKGVGQQKILSARKTSDDTAFIKTCADERTWTLTAMRSGKKYVIQGTGPKINEINLLKEGVAWKISSTNSRKASLATPAEVNCK